MTQAEPLAARHEAAFAGQMRGWSAQEFEDLIASPHVHLIDAAHAFAVIRVVAGEAEILTLATDAHARLQGAARALLHALENEARHLNATRIFLDVSETNAPARALYAAAGYGESSRRAGYYQAPNGQRSDALILEKTL